MNDTKEEKTQNAIVDKFNPQAVATMRVGETNIDLGQAMEFAKLMALSLFVPKHLRSKPADCLAVFMQANRWSMDPFAVANKTYFVNDRIAYEAQLVNAVINQSRVLKERLTIEHFDRGTSTHTCKVTGQFKGENKTHEILQEINTITIKNSPLWKQAPAQQLAYYTTRLWVRMYAPEVLLGVYTPEEIESIGYDQRGPYEAKDITPRPEIEAEEPETINGDLKEGKDPQATEQPEPQQEAAEVEPFGPVIDCFGQYTSELPDQDAWVATMIKIIEECPDAEKQKEVIEHNEVLLSMVKQNNEKQWDEIMSHCPK